MDYETIVYDADIVGRVVFNRWETLNAQSRLFLRDLKSAFHAAPAPHTWPREGKSAAHDLANPAPGADRQNDRCGLAFTKPPLLEFSVEVQP